MSRSSKHGAAIVVFVMGCLLPEKSVSLPTVKYEFSESSPNVVLAGGNYGINCPGNPNLYIFGSATISFTDPQVGGSPVTFQAGYACSGGASGAVTVNTVAAGNLPMPGNVCCSVTPAVESLLITAAYNNEVSTKTVTLANNGMYLPFTGNQNTTDPIFRITYTMIPGVSTPTPGGFTNSLLPTLSWPVIPGATAYEIQVHTDPFFNTPFKDYFPASNQITLAVPNLTNGVTYYTRVKATNGAFSGAWSYIGDFTVATTLPGTPPGTGPTLVAPAANANVPVQTPTFNWSTVTPGPE